MFTDREAIAQFPSSCTSITVIKCDTYREGSDRSKSIILCFLNWD
ncbi:MAG: hypothetical protein ACKPCI_31510 [Dolichospermum sp.]